MLIPLALRLSEEGREGNEVMGTNVGRTLLKHNVSKNCGGNEMMAWKVCATGGEGKCSHVTRTFNSVFCYDVSTCCSLLHFPLFIPQEDKESSCPPLLL